MSSLFENKKALRKLHAKLCRELGIETDIKTSINQAWSESKLREEIVALRKQLLGEIA